MKKIQLTDMKQKQVSQEEAAAVKGGPHFRNFHGASFDFSGSTSVSNVTLKRG